MLAAELLAHHMKIERLLRNMRHAVPISMMKYTALSVGGKEIDC